MHVDSIMPSSQNGCYRLGRIKSPKIAFITILFALLTCCIFVIHLIRLCSFIFQELYLFQVSTWSPLNANFSQIEQQKLLWNHDQTLLWMVESYTRPNCEDIRNLDHLARNPHFRRGECLKYIFSLDWAQISGGNYKIIEDHCRNWWFRQVAIVELTGPRYLCLIRPSESSRIEVKAAYDGFWSKECI